jgi:clostripain
MKTISFVGSPICHKTLCHAWKLWRAAIVCLVLVVGPCAMAGDPARAKASNGSDSASPQRAWTILVYGAADNSADGPVIQFMNRVRRAIDDDPGIELLFFIDRSEKHVKRRTYLGDDFTSTRLYRLRKDSAERLSGGSHFPEITTDKDTKLNSADARNLGRFVAWGKANYPARRYALLIYSHADGHTMCPVNRTRDSMTIPELTEKVTASEKVDFLALELCLMGGIEVAYQWRPGNGGFEADVLLAIPNAGEPLDWDRVFARIRTPGHASEKGPTLDPATMSAADFGRLVIEEGRLGREASAKRGRRVSLEAAGCYDLRAAADVKKAVDALSVELARARAKSLVMELRSAGAEGAAITYTNEFPYVDLYDLCRRLAGCDRLAQPARAAARSVLTAVERFMIGSFGMSGYKGFEAGKNGVYIVLPSDAAGCWKQLDWYTPLAGPGKSGRWSFLKDGATPGNGVVENWFELLVTWFDEGDTAANRYRP